MKTLLITLLFILSVSPGVAQAPAIVKSVAGTQLKPASDAQNKWQNQTWNGMVFYQGTGSPAKLCVTDGTNAGTRFVADLGTGGFHAVLPAKDFVYIVTSEVVSFSPFTFKYEIWKSDGTASGTSNVYILPNAIGVSNGGQFFSDRQATYNFCLDGTTNLLYFGQYDAVNGNELWRTDGTAAGTFMLKDIKPGSGGSFPWGFCKIGNEVFFSATEITFERKLWKTDGTAAGTVQVPVAEPFFIVDGAIARLGNKMVFFANNTVDGYEPYISDGTPAGTFMLGNFNTTAVNSGNSGLPYVDEANLKANSKYCFLVLHNGTDTSLYRTDGTIGGTIRVAPVGTSVSCRVSSGGYSDVDENGIWVMQFNNAGSGNAETLYRSDGTLAGTYQAADNISYGQKLKTYKNAVWFQARNTGSAANVEPWRSGGNAASTNKAFEIEPAVVPFTPFTPYSSTPYGFFTLNNDLYFWAATSIPSGHNLYKYTGNFTFNGTVAGGNWKDSANWNGLMPPGITDSVFVNAGTPNALNIAGATAYAGTLVLGNNAAVIIAAGTDSLIVNTRLAPSGNNSFTGNGVLALRSAAADTVEINSGFTAANLAVQSTASVAAGTVNIGNVLHLTNNSQLIVNNSSIVLTGSSSTVAQAGNSYINTNGTGKLTIENIGAAGRTGAVNFPVGTSADYNPVVITNSGTADHFSVRVQPQAFAAYTGENGTSAYTTNTVDATWFITEAVAGGSSADITLQWNAAQELPGFDRSASRFGHYTSSWQLGATGAAAGADPYTYIGTGITSFSPFGIFNNAGVLPLQFVQLTAQKCGNDNACINWQTANEINVSHFVIERSIDAQTYVAVATVAAQNRLSNNYNYTDAVASLHYSSKIYYRIKQVDANGKWTYSNTVFVNSNNDISVTVYPNPATAALYVHGWEQAAAFEIYNSNGSKIAAMKPAARINVNDVASGTYFLRVWMKSGGSTIIKFNRQ